VTSSEPDRSVSLCPSAQPDWPQAIAIGTVGGTADAPRVTHLETALPVTADLLALVDPVTPAEVLRFAAPCLCDGCVHYDDDTCHLAQRVIDVLPPVTERLPKCSIRRDCRWWQQEGREACTRCPQIVTDNYNADDAMRRAAYGRLGPSDT
jgi:hypothetical protein